MHGHLLHSRIELGWNARSQLDGSRVVGGDLLQGTEHNFCPGTGERVVGIGALFGSGVGGSRNGTVNCLRCHGQDLLLPVERCLQVDLLLEVWVRGSCDRMNVQRYGVERPVTQKYQKVLHEP